MTTSDARREEDFGLWRELRTIASRGRESWRLVPPRRRWTLGVASAVAGGVSAINVAVALLLGGLIKALEQGQREGLAGRDLAWIAAPYLGGLVGSYVVREALNVLKRYLVEDTCLRIDKEMRLQLLSHLMTVDLETLGRERVGALHGRIGRSVGGFLRFIRIWFLDFFPAILSGTLALATALSRQPWIGLAMTGVVPIAMWLTVQQIRTQKGVRLELMRAAETLDGTIVEQLSGLDYVRAANTHRREVARVEAVAEAKRTREMKHHIEMSLFGAAKATNEAFFHVLVLAACVYLAVMHRISAGDIFTYSLLFLNVMTPLSEFHRFLDEAHESSLQVGDLLTLLGHPVDRSFHTPDDLQPSLEPAAPLVRMDDVCVSYRLHDGRLRQALNGVSMEIRHGETIGVAGPSGGGKTTWVRVLLRLTHPSSGAVTIGGLPLESVSRQAIGDLIGYVGQTPFLFAGTVSENIAYGVDHATPEQVYEAARRASILDEIQAMPGGFDAQISERGQNLSGGQRQRIALARVFLRNPPILILDEGTSALDTISERMIQRGILAARADRTVILIAHRLSTLIDVDRIFVFDGGRIAESGPYASLVAQGGLFSELVRSAEGDSIASQSEEPSSS
jgi:ATP-binding cassette subfamily B protein